MGELRPHLEDAVPGCLDGYCFLRYSRWTALNALPG